MTPDHVEESESNIESAINVEEMGVEDEATGADDETDVEDEATLVSDDEAAVSDDEAVDNLEMGTDITAGVDACTCNTSRSSLHASSSCGVSRRNLAVPFDHA